MTFKRTLWFCDKVCLFVLMQQWKGKVSYFIQLPCLGLALLWYTCTQPVFQHRHLKQDWGKDARLGQLEKAKCLLHPFCTRGEQLSDWTCEPAGPHGWSHPGAKNKSQWERASSHSLRFWDSFEFGQKILLLNLPPFPWSWLETSTVSCTEYQEMGWWTHWDKQKRSKYPVWCLDKACNHPTHFLNRSQIFPDMMF